MKKIGRNDPCPCGSGLKYKRCHLGRENGLAPDQAEEITVDVSGRITGLPRVHYGRSREMIESLDLKTLAGSAKGIVCVDLDAYLSLDLFGRGEPRGTRGRRGGILINVYKTIPADPENIYLAISPGIDDSTLVHELAHVLDYLGGSGLMPGTLEPLSFETNVPVDHLEHTDRFGYWLDDLSKRFDVTLDADDTIIQYLYREGMLLGAREVSAKSRLVLKSKSDAIFAFLSRKREEIDALIRARPGYLGPRPS